MKVRGDFYGPPRSTDKTTLIIIVRKGAKIRNRYNQSPNFIAADNYLPVPIGRIIIVLLFWLSWSLWCKPSVNKF